MLRKKEIIEIMPHPDILFLYSYDSPSTGPILTMAEKGKVFRDFMTWWFD